MSVRQPSGARFLAGLGADQRLLAQTRMTGLMIEELTYRQLLLADAVLALAADRKEHGLRRRVRRLRRLVRQIDGATVAIAISVDQPRRRRKLRKAQERSLLLRARLTRELEVMATLLEDDPLRTGEAFEALSDEWTQVLSGSPVKA